jgi:hypothetical protein
MKSCTNNFGGTKLSGEVPLGVQAEKRLNTAALDHIKYLYDETEKSTCRQTRVDSIIL